MSDQITVASVQQYTTNVQLLLQQRGSKLASTVMTMSYTGKAAKAVEQIGAVAAQKRTSRHADTPLINTPHDARWVHPQDYEWADLIDKQDLLRMLTDPTSSYATNGGYAMGRSKDDEILLAVFGTSKTGENGSTNTTFDTTNQQIASGSAGLTIAKLRTAIKILRSNEVDLDFDPLVCIVTAKQIDDLKATTEFTNVDYASNKALATGVPNQFNFMGIHFVHCERLGVDGSDDRRVPLYAKSGMHLGMWNDIETNVDKRPDKGNAQQVLVTGTFGATRTEEGKVVEILCSE